MAGSAPVSPTLFHPFCRKFIHFFFLVFPSFLCYFSLLSISPLFSSPCFLSFVSIFFSSFYHVPQSPLFPFSNFLFPPLFSCFGSFFRSFLCPDFPFLLLFFSSFFLLPPFLSQPMAFFLFLIFRFFSKNSQINKFYTP